MKTSSITLVGAFMALFIVHSCKSGGKTEPTDIATSYAQCTGQFVSNRHKPQEFLDSLTLAIQQIQIDNHGSINKKGLETLRKEALEVSNKRISHTLAAKEIDEQIAMRKKVLAYHRMAKDLLENEFVQVVNILGSESEHRFQECAQILTLKLNELKSTSTAANEAIEAFEQEYHISMTDSDH